MNGHNPPPADQRHEGVTGSLGSQLGFPPDFDLRRQLGTFWRRRWLVLGTMMLVLGATWVVVSQLVPIYTATARIMIDTRRTRFVDFKEVMSAVAPQLTTVLSEVEVVRSRDLAERVADKLDLYADPEFNLALRPQQSSLIGSGMEALRSLFGAERVPPSEEEKRRHERAAVVSIVQSRTAVSPVQQSLVINVGFSSPNPKTAARLANAIVEHYVLDQLEAKFEATRQASSWLNERVEGLRQSVVTAEKAVSVYKTQSGLIENKGVLPSQTQLAELNSQLIQTQAKRTELEAKVSRLEALVRTDRGAEAADEMMDSPLIQRLRESEVTLAREISDMTQRYGNRHPRMIKATAELGELRGKIANEMSKLGHGLRNEFGVMRAREQALRDQIRRIEGTLIDQNRAEVRLRELEREAQANRQLYENFLNRFKETSEQENIQQPDARIISRAVQPLSPTFPRTGLLLAGGALVGLMLGTVLVFLLEKLENSFRSQKDLEDATGVPAIGIIPFVGKGKAKGDPGAYLLSRPASSFAESFRSLWVALSHGGDGPPRVLAVTSSLPAEGKSLSALSLARTVANLGMRVVLVDCDLRRSVVAGMLKLPNSPTIDDVLVGRAGLDAALAKDPLTELAVLPARTLERPSLDLLTSAAMHELIAELRGRYDLVVLDCPPVIPVSEPQVIGRMADKVLFCVRWDNTPRDAVKTALRMLSDGQLNLAGTVLTQVNVAKHARYGYGDMGHYYGRYTAYYAD